MNHTASPDTGNTTTARPALRHRLSFVQVRPGGHVDWLAVPHETFSTDVMTGITLVHELLSTGREDDDYIQVADAFEKLITAACAELAKSSVELAKPSVGVPVVKKNREGVAVGVMYSVSRLLASATTTDDGATVPALEWLQSEILEHLKKNRIRTL